MTMVIIIVRARGSEITKSTKKAIFNGFNKNPIFTTKILLVFKISKRIKIESSSELATFFLEFFSVKYHFQKLLT